MKIIAAFDSAFGRGIGVTAGLTLRPAQLSRAAILLLGLGLSSCCSTKSHLPPPATAESLDLYGYTGRWYEIARLPMPFQKAGEAAIAEYGANPDGTISV